MRALVLLVLAACTKENPNYRPPADAGHVPSLHVLQIDFVGCRPISTGPTYDGDLWAPGAGSIRCGVPIEAGDTVTQWIAFGRRDGTGTGTVACLQRLGTVLTPGATRHVDVGPCDTEASDTIGDFSLTSDPAWSWTVTEDDVVSLRITGSGGDRLGSATVLVLRQ